jgi:micrococcal nuclease
LVYGTYIFDTYTYNPKKLSTKDEEALTTTGYTVSSVLDGDTFRIKYQGKTQSIRLLGVDAPESTKTRYKHLECFGTEAKNYLKSLIDKKKITFQFDPSQDQKDIYDRLLAYVYLDDELINQKMVEDGYAKEYTYKTVYTYQSQFKQAEQSAQDQQLGLRNETTCGVSLSGIQLTGDIETTGAILDLSGLQFTITYVLPNPK